MKKIAFLFCFLLLIFNSCIKEVKLENNALPQKVVVNGAICPDSVFKVRVSLSSNMHTPKQMVNNATVKVYEDGVFWANLPHIGNGEYRASINPNEGKKYKIEVSVPNFEMVYAETEIPIFPQVLTAKYEKISNTPYEGDHYPSKTTIVFQDDPNKENFYIPGKNKYMYEQTQEIDESILTESDLDFHPAYYYFSDVQFNGNQKNLQIMGGGNIWNMFGTFFYQQDYEHTFSIVSKEFYQGLKTWTIHSFNQSSNTHVNDPTTLLFLGEPIEMYSNVIGGLGVFAGYNSKSIPIAPHE